MKRTVFIAGMVLLFGLRIGAQSKPFIGYDKVPWGASVTDVRTAFGIADTIQAEIDKDDKNITRLAQTNGGVKREFLFNGGKLYRVWVFYNNGEFVKNPQTDLLQSLKTALAQRYGNPTNTTSREWDSTEFVGFTEVTYYYTENYTFYGKFAPDIEVELQYLKGDAFYPIRVTAYQIRVCYTWKKFRDEYQASKLQL